MAKKKAQPSEAEEQIRIEYMRLTQVEAAFVRGNPRVHNVRKLAEIIRELGFNAPPMMNERAKKLTLGHGRTKAVRWLYEDDPEMVPERVKVAEDGEWMIPVYRGASFTRDQAERYLMADNRAGELGKTDKTKAAVILERLRKKGKLAGTGYSNTQVERILQKVRAGQPEEDSKIPEVPDDPGVQRGDLFALGKHRIMCGDAMEDADVDRLLGGDTVCMVLTDPPFAMYGSSTGIGADITDDKMVRPFFTALARQIHRVTKTFGHIYVHCDWRSYATLYGSFSGKLSPKNLLVWDKGDGGLGGSYMQCHELVSFWAKLPPPTAMKSTTQRGQRQVNDSNLLRHNRPTGSDRLHNAAKPVAMLARIIRNSSDSGDRVLDLFAGSGSTLIACEREDRICLTMDIEPKEVRKTILRWELETGQEARRLDPAA